MIQLIKSDIKNLCFNSISSNKGSRITLNGEEVNNINFDILYNDIKLNDLIDNFCGGSAIVYKDRIHIFSNATNSYDKQCIWDGIDWSERYFYNASSTCTVIYDDKIHVISESDDGSSSTMYSYHYAYDGSSWTSVSTAPGQFRMYCCAAVLNDSIHVIGCINDDTSKKVHYKWDGTSWTKLEYPSGFTFKSNLALTYNNEMHIFGFCNGYYTKHYKYNGTSWTSVSTLPYSVSYDSSRVLIHNNKIHLLGGSGNYRSHYELNGTVWTKLKNLPYEFNNGCAVSYRGNIYICGGHTINTYYKDFYSLNREFITKIK